ncbi:MAG: cytochrome c-type biogenesis protein [Pseudomonadota bacterium]
MLRKASHHSRVWSQPASWVGFAAFILVLLVQPQTALADDDRTKALFNELRCVVCQNQSIAESDADVAKDLREIVREQIGAGKTDSQIKTFLVDRYGEFILLKPVLSWHTALLWLAPALFLLFSVLLLIRRFSSRSVAIDDRLNAQEEQELKSLLKEKT